MTESRAWGWGPGGLGTGGVSCDWRGFPTSFPLCGSWHHPKRPTLPFTAPNCLWGEVAKRQEVEGRARQQLEGEEDEDGEDTAKVVGTFPRPVAAPEMLTFAHIRLLASHGAVEGVSLWQVTGKEPGKIQLYFIAGRLFGHLKQREAEGFSRESA